ncbi:hypothetical protein [Ponticaulis profundi]|uniref:Uncharacterized protein n=1 Tax=Ponticaulis profundi TaxID=2665222 RepID=A0ABW1SA49_9PROT
MSDISMSDVSGTRTPSIQSRPHAENALREFMITLVTFAGGVGSISLFSYLLLQTTR